MIQTIVECVFLLLLLFFSSSLSHFLCCILTWVEFVVGCLPYREKFSGKFSPDVPVLRRMW